MRIGLMCTAFMWVLLINSQIDWAIQLALGFFSLTGGWAISEKLDEIRKSLDAIGGLMLMARQEDKEM